MASNERENSDGMLEKLIAVNRVAKVVKGGRQFGFTALTGGEDIVLVPIRSGVGARLGVNLGYLKITSSSTWNPF